MYNVKYLRETFCDLKTSHAPRPNPVEQRKSVRFCSEVFGTVHPAPVMEERPRLFDNPKKLQPRVPPHSQINTPRRWQSASAAPGLPPRNNASKKQSGREVSPTASCGSISCCLNYMNLYSPGTATGATGMGPHCQP